MVILIVRLGARSPGNGFTPFLAIFRVVTFSETGTLFDIAMPETILRTGTALSDEEVVERVLTGETALYEIIMRRYNRRLYRAVKSVLRDEDEVEDVMQDAYVRAYKHLADFEGRSQFFT